MNRMIKNLLKKSFYKLQSNDFRINSRLRNIKKEDRLTILNIHSVSNNTKSTYRTLKPELLDELILFIRNFPDVSFFKFLVSDNFKTTTLTLINFNFLSIFDIS